MLKLRLKSMEAEELITKLISFRVPRRISKVFRKLVFIKLEESNLFTDYETLTGFMLSLMIYLLPLATTTSFLLLYLKFVDLLGCILIALSFLTSPILIINLWLFERKVSRMGTVKREMPAFTLIMSILGEVGGLNSGFKVISEKFSSFFKGISVELKIIRRNQLFFHKDLKKAVLEAVKNSPCREFREYMLEYVDTLSKSGSIKEFTESQMNRFLELIEERWSMLQKSIQMQLDAAILFFGILPISLSILSFIVEQTKLISLLIGFLIIYVFSFIALITYLDEVQVQMRDHVSLNRFLPLSTAISLTSALTLIFLLKLDPYLSLVASIAIFTLPLTINSINQLREIGLLENESKHLLRDLINHMRIGFSVEESLRKTNLNEYRCLGKFLSIFQSGLESGRSPTEIVNSLEIKSRFVKMLFISIAVIMESGGGLSELERLSKFTEKYLDRKKQTYRNGLVSASIAIFIPLIGLFGLSLMESVLSLVSQESIQISLALPINMVNLQLISLTCKMLILTSTVIISLTLSKMINGNLSNTLFLTLSLLILLVGLVISPYLKSLIT